jgi:hypothetical protein
MRSVEVRIRDRNTTPKPGAEDILGDCRGNKSITSNQKQYFVGVKTSTFVNRSETFFFG